MLRLPLPLRPHERDRKAQSRAAKLEVRKLLVDTVVQPAAADRPPCRRARNDLEDLCAVATDGELQKYFTELRAKKRGQ